MGRLINPLVSARQRGRRDADFWTHASDEDLETCMALIDVASGGPFPHWSQELVAEICIRTEARMKKAAREKKDTEQVEVEIRTAKDFRSLLASSWDRADDALRNSLRTVGIALGVSVPQQPLRRTRFPEPQPVAADGADAGNTLATPDTRSSSLRTLSECDAPSPRR